MHKVKKKSAAKAVMKAKIEMWDKTCLKINRELGFKRSKEAWAILKEMINQS
jgi:hypothetical protein